MPKVNIISGSELIQSEELKAGTDDPWAIAVVEGLYAGQGKKYVHIPVGDDYKSHGTYTISCVECEKRKKENKDDKNG